MRVQSVALSLASVVPFVLITACGGSDSGGDGFTSVGSTGGSGVAGSGLGGTGTAGTGVAGSGVAGKGTSGGAGSGTAGTGTSGGAGSGTAGTGTSGGGGSTGGSGPGGSGGSGPAGFGGSGPGGGGGAGGSTGGFGGSGPGGAGGSLGGSAGAGGSGPTGFPTTCAEASATGSSLGCEFWPVVTANLVWSIFDFAVVVSNPGAQPANVVVTRGAFTTSVSVPAGKAAPIYLPWVDALKGPDADAQGGATALAASVREDGGAYKLVSDVPVAVVQHNAIEYQGKGGPPGKSWDACPGSATGGIGCFSFSNDASMLLPRHALGTTYRVLQSSSWSNMGTPVTGAFLSITGVESGTTVTVTTGPKGATLAGGGIAGGTGGQMLTLALDAGDVVQIAAPGTDADFSGTTIASNKPVQVVGGIPCTQVPLGKQACDHLEESLWPSKVAGAEYVIAPPTGPKGDAPGLVVRMGGLNDGTMLSYSPSAPPGAPTLLDAGQVVELPVSAAAYRVMGSKAFQVALLVPSAEVLDPMNMAGDALGDPSLSYAIPTARYVTHAVFGTPSDYEVTYLDVLGQTGSNLLLDGAPVTVPPTSIAGSFGVFRIKLPTSGAHVLESDQPFGAQVLGYGKYTSYMHPAGLKLGN